MNAIVVVVAVITLGVLAFLGRKVWEKGIKSPDHRWLVTLALYSTVIGISIPFTIEYSNQYFNPTEYVAILVIGHFVYAMTRSLPLDSTGAVLFLGQIVVVIKKSGPVFVPPLFYKMIMGPVGPQEIELPGPTDEVHRGDEDLLPPGKVLAMRFTGAETNDIKGLPDTLQIIEIENDGEDRDKIDHLQSNRLTAEVTAQYQFQIVDIANFIRNFQTPENFKKIIEDTVRSKILQIFGKLTIATILSNIDKINDHLKLEMEEKLSQLIAESSSSSGIHSGILVIKNINLGKTVNRSMADRTKALYDKDATISAAEANAEKIALEGKAQAEADSALYRVLGETLRKHPEAERAYLIEKATEALKGLNPTVFLGGNGESSGLVQMATKAIDEWLKSRKESK